MAVQAGFNLEVTLFSSYTICGDSLIVILLGPWKEREAILPFLFFYA